MNGEQLTWMQAFAATFDASLLLGLVSCLLLALVAGLLLAVGQQVQAVRKEMRAAPLLAEELARQLLAARTALEQLKRAAAEAAPGIEKNMNEANRVRQDLQFLAARGEQLAARLEGQVAVLPAAAGEVPLPGRESGRVATTVAHANSNAATQPGPVVSADPLETLLAGLSPDMSQEPVSKMPRRGKPRTVSQAELDLREKLAG